MDEKVQRYFNAIPRDKKPMFEKLHTLIMSMYPDTNLVLSYGVPTYRAGAGWVALGYWKGGVSVYPHGRLPVLAFKKKYPDIKTGAGTINFKLTDTIPVNDLKKVIKHAMERPNIP